MAITLKQVQELRNKTGLGVMECRNALDETNGDMKKAEAILAKKAAKVAAKKADRSVGQGLIHAYVHGTKIGVLVEINCESDFVAKNEEFKTFVNDVAMQVASMNPANLEELLEQDFIKDPSIKMKELLNQKIQKIGENIKIKRFIRYELGE